MDKEQIKMFLAQKPGYLKEGKKRLKALLQARGYDVTEEDCAIALKESRDQDTNIILEGQDGDSNIKVLIYDIETSYNIVKAFRTGYNKTISPGDIIKERAVICVSYKWLGDTEVNNIQWDANQCDKKLLEQFIPIMNEADLLVAHNGDKFDLRFLKARALKHDVPMLINYPHFDTCKVARKKFDLNSNKLDYIASYLGVGEKIKVDMSLWDRVILEKSIDAMDEMIHYCNIDVEVLEKVYKRLIYWEYPKVHEGALINQSISPTGKSNFELVKTTTTAGGTVKRVMKCLDTNRLFEMSNTTYKKYLKDQEDWDAKVELSYTTLNV